VGLMSAEPQPHRSELNHDKEVGSELVVAGSDAAEVLQLGEEALDQVAFAVKPFAEAGLPASAALRRDVRRGALVLDQLANLSGSTMVRGPRWSSNVSAIWPSCVCPGVRPRRIGRPCGSTTTWILVVSPPRDRPRH